MQPEITPEGHPEVASTSGKRRLGHTVRWWAQLYGIWALLLIIAGILGFLWFQKTISYQENRSTERVDLATYGITPLEVHIQYPTSLPVGSSTVAGKPFRPQRSAYAGLRTHRKGAKDAEVSYCL